MDILLYPHLHIVNVLRGKSCFLLSIYVITIYGDHVPLY